MKQATCNRSVTVILGSAVFYWCSLVSTERLLADGESAGNASAKISPTLTPAGHVGADVEVTFPGPQFYAVDDWGVPHIDGDRIVIDATTGPPFTKGGNPPFPPDRASHLYKLFDVQRTPSEIGEPVPYRTVGFPAGTSSIPAGTVVLRSLQEWNDWIAPYDLTLGPLPVAPPVDFDREIFIGVFLGQTSGCHAVEIRRISTQTDGTILVNYTAALPAPGKPVTENLIDPRHIVALARTDAPVTFLREESVIPGPAVVVPLTRADYTFLAPEEPMTTVIRSESAWGRFLDRVAGQRDPALPAPPVDFSRQMVIGVFLGRTPLGMGVGVTEVSDDGMELLVKIQETIGGAAPPPDEFTYPYDFVAIPKSDLPVRFEREVLALPSPPPPTELREPRDETRHGYFEIIFRLNNCELASQSFVYPEVPPPAGVVLDALPESTNRLALDVKFDLGSTEETIAEWATPIRNGKNISVNVTLSPRPEVPSTGIGFPGTGSHSHQYVFDTLEAGLYRFELRVNGIAAGHVFFRDPASQPAVSEFARWLEPLLIRPVWEPVPDAGLLGDLDGDTVGDFLEFTLGSDPLDFGSMPTWTIRTIREAADPGRVEAVELALTKRRAVAIGLNQSVDLVTWMDASPTTEATSKPLDADWEQLTLRWHPPTPSGSHATFFQLRASE
ncbi:MAG: protease complex subunit PrcB family protein [Verrucomicrobiae bacterium]|nr:protease complex subunit PrcB family protein [Verrucomicrobiae bacterium]